MAKTKRPYSSIGLDTELLNDPSFLQSDAMKRIDDEQAGSSAGTEAQQRTEVTVQLPEPPLPEAPPTQVAKSAAGSQDKVKEKSALEDIFTRGSMRDRDFSSLTLHHDILEDLHELARIRDGEGRRYPVKYLATNIIKCYLSDHKEEIEKIKKEFRMRRG